jgi:cellulose synthase operon protein C
VPTVSPARPPRRPPLLLGLGALLLVAFSLALYAWFAGDAHTLPVGTVAQLTPLPVTLARLPTGPDSLAVQANGYLVTQNYDVAGPELWPAAAAAWLLLLGAGLTVWLAVISQLARPAFLLGASLVIFLLMALSLDALEIFHGSQQYLLMLALGVLLLPAFLLQAFFSRVGLGWRLLLFAALVAGLAVVLFTQAPQSTDQVLLHLAAYATLPGLAAVALLSLWLGGELIYGLLWLNTQGATPNGRFGLLPFVLSSGLLLGIMVMYYWNGGQLAVLPGVHLEPYLLLLAAAGIGWWTLPRREPTYLGWLPYRAAAPLYLVLLLLALGGVAYAAATANTPLLQAGRDLANLILAAVGAAFFAYVLLNFAPLIRAKKQVHRVAYDPRRMPFFAMYAFGTLVVAGVLMRNKFDVLDLARAGEYIQLGDLTRYQSEQQPENFYLAALTERYYAEADQLDPRNARAALGRAALFQLRAQRQNEINVLRQALQRESSEKVLLRLNARYDQPADFFDRQQLLRQGLRAFPASARLNAEMAQLYTRSALADSVQYYQRRALAAEADNPVAHTNWLAYLLKNELLPAAQQAVQEAPKLDWPAWQNNAWVLALQQGRFQPVAAARPAFDSVLTVPQFAQLYHVGLAQAVRRDTSQLPLVQQLRRVGGNDAFADQLAFLSGLQLLRSSRPAAGFDQLEALTIGSAAGYYHQLLGQYLLERGLYASAAARLALAEEAGSAAAAVPAAYALYWAGQPDSARTAARRAVQATPTATTPLQRLLSGGVPAPQTPVRPLAAAYRRAASLEATAPKKAAAEYRRLVQADPFDEAGALEASAFFARRRDLLTAYEMLQRAASYNPESVQLLKNLVLTAADAGLDEYAISSLNKLSTLLPSTEYSIFRSQYDKRRVIHQAAAAPWN